MAQRLITEEQVAKARQLRARGWKYRDIASHLGLRDYQAIWRHLNPERQRTIEQRRQAEKNAWSDANYHKPCPRCGTPIRKNRHGVCQSCRTELDNAQRRSRRSLIAELWRQGKLIREIASALDSTPGSIGAEMAHMRADGWDLPHRRTPSRTGQHGAGSSR